MLLSMLLQPLRIAAQEAPQVLINPEVSYAGVIKNYTIANLSVNGVDGYEDYMLTSISGLSVGQEISVPGSEITDAVKRYWKHGLFSEVKISADSIVGDSIYLAIHLKTRPRVSRINYLGIKKKSEREDMEQKLGLLKGSQVTPNMISRAQILAKKYYEEKGFNNCEVNIRQRDDVAEKNHVILDVDIDKKQKIKVHRIYIIGNKAFKEKKLKGSIFGGGALKKLREVNTLAGMFRSKKYTPEKYKEDKDNIITFYNSMGYRDAVLLHDSVATYDDRHVDIYFNISEGEKYYLRNVTWVGNTVYTTDYLSNLLGMKKGDVYNQTLLNKRLREDDDAVGNAYWNHGYLFYDLTPVEINIDGDSIDLEMRIQEGPQAHISHVRITGNNRLYEKVVRRELRTKPGDLFSKDALMRSAREIASMGHFDQEKVNPDVKPNYEDGTVDINWDLEQKSNDQVEFSLGWG